MKSLIFTFLVSIASALPSTSGAPSGPLVKVKNGTYEGIYLSGLKQDLFVGVPYAEPPTGNLRYRPPHYIETAWEGVRPATKLPNACPQYPLKDSIYEQGAVMNEDCLALNIVKPAGDVSGLPVVVWIHGGSYQNGYSALTEFNMSYIVQQSVEMGKPIIGVSINYRLAFFGFLASNEVLNSQNANLGLRDQELAFQWVDENIEAFGGDPTKVTIAGQSAGAMSVGAHLFSHGGENNGLYRAAFLMSGGATVDAYNGTDYYQSIYDGIVAAVNCSQAYDTLDCLRYVEYDELYAVLNNTYNNLYRFDYMPIIDGDLLREWPHSAMLAGRTADVPILSGSVTDEGTAFCPTNINTTQEMYDYLLYDGQYKQKKALVERLLELYPDDPALGSPFDQTNTTTYTGFGLQFKRIAAMLGDYLLIAANRFTAQTSANLGRNVWTYRFDIRPAGTPEYLGIYHTTDIAFWFHIPTATRTAKQNATSLFMTRSWISFIHDLDPNGAELGDRFPTWPKFNDDAANMVFKEECYLEKADFREEGISYINEHLLEFVS